MAIDNARLDALQVIVEAVFDGIKVNQPSPTSIVDMTRRAAPLLFNDGEAPRAVDIVVARLIDR